MLRSQSITMATAIVQAQGLTHHGGPQPYQLETIMALLAAGIDPLAILRVVRSQNRGALIHYLDQFLYATHSISNQEVSSWVQVVQAHTAVDQPQSAVSHHIPQTPFTLQESTSASASFHRLPSEAPQPGTAVTSSSRQQVRSVTFKTRYCNSRGCSKDYVHRKRFINHAMIEHKQTEGAYCCETSFPSAEAYLYHAWECHKMPAGNAAVQDDTLPTSPLVRHSMPEQIHIDAQWTPFLETRPISAPAGPYRSMHNLMDHMDQFGVTDVDMV